MNDETRLNQYPDILTLVFQCQTQRELALAASKYALEKTEISDPVIDKALLALHSGQVNDKSMISHLNILQTNFEERYFDSLEENEINIENLIDLDSF